MSSIKTQLSVSTKQPRFLQIDFSDITILGGVQLSHEIISWGLKEILLLFYLKKAPPDHTGGA